MEPYIRLDAVFRFNTVRFATPKYTRICHGQIHSRDVISLLSGMLKIPGDIVR